MNATLSAGRIVSMGGYFTHARYLRSQGADELERRLGYRKGRLADGWWLLFLQQMPTPDQFEARGTSASSARRDREPAEDRPDEEALLRAGGKVFSLKSRTLKDTFFLNGPGRLAKLVPAALPFAEPEQPPAGAIAQYELAVPLPFRVICLVEPGATYTGDYV